MRAIEIKGKFLMPREGSLPGINISICRRGYNYDFIPDPEEYSGGIYFIEILAGDTLKVFKVLKL